MFRFALPMRLLLIASVALLPMALVCGLSLNALLDKQQEQMEASTLGVVRALATAIEGELRLTVSALQAVAMIDTLGATNSGGLIEARELATAVRQSHPEWLGLLLATPNGEIIFNTDAPTGASGRVVEMASLAAVVKTRQPTIGTMTRGPSGQLGFAVRAPVLRDGKVRYVLTAVVKPEAISAVLKRQRVPEGWTVSVFDSANVRVARTVDEDRLRGAGPSPTLQTIFEALGNRREMLGDATTTDGVRTLTAVAIADFAHWKVALGAPVSTAEDARDRTLWAYGASLLLSLLVGGCAAWWMSRSITLPMARLRREADALGAGQPVSPALGSDIPEIAAVATALVDASTQRAQNELERDRLLAVAQDAKQRLDKLLRASELLSQSLEESSTLSSIAQVVVPDFADLCRIDLLDENGVLVRKMTHHYDPSRGAMIEKWVGARTAPTEAPGSFPWAIATGRTFLHNIDDPSLPRITDPEQREFMETLHITAACVVPLIARGRTLGAMAVLQAGSGRRFSAEDGALISELARRAALALDNVRLLAEARSAQTEAEDANRTKDEFLAMLGHELRNPLAPISLALQLIARRDAQAFPRERQIIERQVKHLSRMVDDLLDVSRIVSGKISLAFEQVDLRDVVARALELTLPALQARQAMPQVSLPAVDVPVRGDPTRLAQIVGNLLNNAAKFTDPKDPIWVELRVEGQQAELSVTDGGIGIAPELLPRVFERFVQGQQALQRASGGLGLGLPIAQSLAALHGGAIEVASEGLGRGSRFTIRLPIERQQEVLPFQSLPTTPSRTLALLVVDDNIDAADALGSWFELEGHAVRVAYSAEQALVMLAAARFDGAVLDIGLPGMSGYELARRIRSEPRTRSLALIALTGYGQDADRARAFNAGFDDHFAKPAQPELLLERLQAFVDKRSASAAQAVLDDAPSQ